MHVVLISELPFIPLAFVMGHYNIQSVYGVLAGKTVLSLNTFLLKSSCCSKSGVSVGVRLIQSPRATTTAIATQSSLGCYGGEAVKKTSLA